MWGQFGLLGVQTYMNSAAKRAENPDSAEQEESTVDNSKVIRLPARVRNSKLAKIVNAAIRWYKELEAESGTYEKMSYDQVLKRIEKREESKLARIVDRTIDLYENMRFTSPDIRGRYEELRSRTGELRDSAKERYSSVSESVARKREDINSNEHAQKVNRWGERQVGRTRRGIGRARNVAERVKESQKVQDFADKHLVYDPDNEVYLSDYVGSALGKFQGSKLADSIKEKWKKFQETETYQRLMQNVEDLDYRINGNPNENLRSALRSWKETAESVKAIKRDIEETKSLQRFYSELESRGAEEGEINQARQDVLESVIGTYSIMTGSELSVNAILAPEENPDGEYDHKVPSFDTIYKTVLDNRLKEIEKGAKRALSHLYKAGKEYNRMDSDKEFSFAGASVSERAKEYVSGVSLYLHKYTEESVLADIVDDMLYTAAKGIYPRPVDVISKSSGKDYETAEEEVRKRTGQLYEEDIVESLGEEQKRIASNIVDTPYEPCFDGAEVPAAIALVMETNRRMQKQLDKYAAEMASVGHEMPEAIPDGVVESVVMQGRKVLQQVLEDADSTIDDFELAYKALSDSMENLNDPDLREAFQVANDRTIEKELRGPMTEEIQRAHERYDQRKTIENINALVGLIEKGQAYAGRLDEEVAKERLTGILEKNYKAAQKQAIELRKRDMKFLEEQEDMYIEAEIKFNEEWGLDLAGLYKDISDRLSSIGEQEDAELYKRQAVGQIGAMYEDVLEIAKKAQNGASLEELYAVHDEYAEELQPLEKAVKERQDVWQVVDRDARDLTFAEFQGLKSRIATKLETEERELKTKGANGGRVIPLTVYTGLAFTSHDLYLINRSLRAAREGRTTIDEQEKEYRKNLKGLGGAIFQHLDYIDDIGNQESAEEMPLDKRMMIHRDVEGAREYAMRMRESDYKKQILTRINDTYVPSQEGIIKLLENKRSTLQKDMLGAEESELDEMGEELTEVYFELANRTGTLDLPSQEAYQKAFEESREPIYSRLEKRLENLPDETVVENLPVLNLAYEAAQRLVRYAEKDKDKEDLLKKARTVKDKVREDIDAILEKEEQELRADIKNGSRVPFQREVKVAGKDGEERKAIEMFFLTRETALAGVCHDRYLMNESDDPGLAHKYNQETMARLDKVYHALQTIYNLNPNTSLEVRMAMHGDLEKSREYAERMRNTPAKKNLTDNMNEVYEASQRAIIWLLEGRRVDLEEKIGYETKQAEEASVADTKKSEPVKTRRARGKAIVKRGGRRYVRRVSSDPDAEESKPRETPKPKTKPKANESNNFYERTMLTDIYLELGQRYRTLGMEGYADEREADFKDTTKGLYTALEKKLDELPEQVSKETHFLAYQAARMIVKYAEQEGKDGFVEKTSPKITKISKGLIELVEKEEQEILRNGKNGSRISFRREGRAPDGGPAVDEYNLPQQMGLLATSHDLGLMYGPIDEVRATDYAAKNKVCSQRVYHALNEIGNAPEARSQEDAMKNIAMHEELEKSKAYVEDMLDSPEKLRLKARFNQTYKKSQGRVIGMLESQKQRLQDMLLDATGDREFYMRAAIAKTHNDLAKRYATIGQHEKAEREERTFNVAVGELYDQLEEKLDAAIGRRNLDPNEFTAVEQATNEIIGYAQQEGRGERYLKNIMRKSNELRRKYANDLRTNIELKERKRAAESGKPSPQLYASLSQRCAEASELSRVLGDDDTAEAFERKANRYAGVIHYNQRLERIKQGKNETGKVTPEQFEECYEVFAGLAQLHSQLGDEDRANKWVELAKKYHMKNQRYQERLQQEQEEMQQGDQL